MIIIFNGTKHEPEKGGFQIFTALCDAVIDRRPLCDFIDGLQLWRLEKEEFFFVLKSLSSAFLFVCLFAFVCLYAFCLFFVCFLFVCLLFVWSEELGQCGPDKHGSIALWSLFIQILRKHVYMHQKQCYNFKVNDG